jgi:hypothetical protein
MPAPPLPVALPVPPMVMSPVPVADWTALIPTPEETVTAPAPLIVMSPAPVDRALMPVLPPCTLPLAVMTVLPF